MESDIESSVSRLTSFIALSSMAMTSSIAISSLAAETDAAVIVATQNNTNKIRKVLFIFKVSPQ